MTEEHLHRLLDRYFDDAMDDDTREALESELLARREARVIFWERARLEEALHSLSGEARGGDQFLTMMRSRTRRRWTRGITAAAAAIALLAGTWFLWSITHRPIEDPEDNIADFAAQESAPVAVMERTAKALWKGSVVPEAGQPLGKGELELQGGLATIGFFSGARVAVEGPSLLQPVSEKAIGIRSGYLQADVPAVARGFTVSLTGADVVSNGGAFEVRSGDSGSEIRNRRGTLELRTKGQKPVTVGERQIATIDGAGKILVRVDTTTPGGEWLGSRIDQMDLGALTVWREASARRAKDPDMLVYLRMDSQEEEERNILINASRHAESDHEAPVIAAKWVEGRWPGKRALSFRNVSDRVRVGLRGSYPQVTFGAWVKIDELQRHFNALFLSQWGLKGEVHWQLSENGGFRFGVRPAKSIGGNFHRAFSSPVAGPEQRGVWKHLVTTYDADKREVIHYVDGRELARTTLPESIPLQFGTATLGNSPVPPPDGWGSRTFGGVIDEFMLYSRVLGPNEIGALYDEGRAD